MEGKIESSQLEAYKMIATGLLIGAVHISFTCAIFLPLCRFSDPLVVVPHWGIHNRVAARRQPERGRT